VGSPRLDLREIEDVVEDGEQDVGRVPDRFEVASLLGFERTVEHEIGHTDDAIHGRTDLVAHVRQELALGAAAFHGLVASGLEPAVRVAELDRPGQNGLFEIGVLGVQLLVAALNLGQHAVEPFDQFANLVSAVSLGPEVVAIVPGNLTSDGGQLQQGP
jgi:hypothetical protein